MRKTEGRVVGKPIRKIHNLDPDSQQYWDEVLKDHHLSMGRAKTTKLSHTGTSNDLVRSEHVFVGNHLYGGRRKRPAGHGPDEE